MKPSEDLEKRVQRIHDLIEESGSKVTWNDHIPDPDNPTQLRQIDVTIKRDGFLTLIECRLHSRAQDVQWIEGLIGRRVSLGAHAVIAVSFSGFTEGAKKKADAHGVLLRDFQELTDDEVRSWGEPKRAFVHHIQFVKIEIRFGVKGEFGYDPASPQFNELVWATLVPIVNGFVEQASENETAKTISLSGEMSFRGTDAESRGVVEAAVSALALPGRREIELRCVSGYDAPEVAAADRQARVAQFSGGVFEIVESKDRSGIAIDLSTFSAPPNSFVYGAGVQFGQITTCSLSILGTSLPQIQAEILTIQIYQA